MVDFTTIADTGFRNSRSAIKTCGSIVKIKALFSETPITYTITGSINGGGLSADLTSDVAVYIEKGTYLYFATGQVVTAESKTIGTTATTIAIQYNAGSISGNCTTYGLVSLPTSNINNNEEVATVPSKNHLMGEQMGEERLSRMLKVGCELVLRLNEIGYFYEALPAALNKANYNGKVFAAIAIPALDNQGGYEFTFGNALITVDGDANPVNEIRRPSVMLNFQPPWLKTSVYNAESTAVKDLIITNCKLAGLPVPN